MNNIVILLNLKTLKNLVLNVNLLDQLDLSYLIHTVSLLILKSFTGGIAEINLYLGIKFMQNNIRGLRPA